MAAEEEFDRIGVREDYGTETGRNGRSRDESSVYEAHPAQGVRDAMPRAAGSTRAPGSPLPVGSGGRPLWLPRAGPLPCLRTLTRSRTRECNGCPVC
jgi:hypothetical protein